jgi:hypothetical protein
MNKFKIPIALIILLALSVSCDDQVNPKTDFKEVYALNCIVKGDTSYQIATISHSYNVSEFDPSSNTTDPFIPGAKIKLFYGDSVFVFRDTFSVRQDISHYTTPIHYYYLKNFRPSDSKTISIQATLPNGSVLSSGTKTFALSNFYFDNRNITYPSGISGEVIQLSWNSLGNSGKDIAIYYAPELVILYTKLINGIKTEFQKKVPIYYTYGGLDGPPIYPPIQVNQLSIVFQGFVLDQSMKEISQNDPDKKNYTIEKAVFRLFVLDKNLAAYYAAQRTFLDEFSVRFSQPDFTNITGGLGIFGTYSVKQQDVQLDNSYVSSFGYNSQ